MKLTFTLNGREVTEDAAPDQTLFAWLRAHHIKSVKCGCETSNCGLCTVWLDDEPVLSCSVLMARVDGHAVTTLEGVGPAREEFARRVANGEFVEWAEVHGNCYGTLVSEVTSKLASGASLILEIDVQGALQVKERFPEAVLIFIKPPSLEVLRERLVGRGTETPETIELRMANAADELALADRYDDVVVNDDLDRATDELVRVLDMHERI